MILLYQVTQREVISKIKRTYA
ncbi:hypothetical protein CCP3SC1_130022 [Gammaproteobacteria bacterium]